MTPIITINITITGPVDGTMNAPVGNNPADSCVVDIRDESGHQHSFVVKEPTVYRAAGQIMKLLELIEAESKAVA
jgi:hypothetical protein